jgi:glucosamine kinase
MLVGIDIGGTKTHVAVSINSRQDGTEFVVPTSRWQQGDLFADRDNAQRLVGLFKEHIDAPSRVAVAIGAHGCDSTNQCESFRQLVKEHHDGPVTVVNDAQLLAPAAGAGTAIAVIIGTGSIVVGEAEHGEPITAGGHGWLLGDPGSAPALARESVRALLKAKDAGKPRDLLARKLMAEYGVSDEVQLTYAFTRNLNITAWGTLAPIIFDAADSGSDVARQVIDSSALELAVSTSQVKNRGALGRDVIVAGGVAINQPRLFNAFCHHMAALAPDLRVTLLAVPPVRGALVLAEKLIQSTQQLGESNEFEQEVV